MIIFFFILTKLLISIVIIRYQYLRSIIQLQNEANARLMQQRGQKSKEKLLNLIFCRRVPFSKTKGRPQIENKQPFWMNFKRNLYEFMNQQDLRSREQRMKELNIMTKKIMKERQKRRKDRAEFYAPHNFSKHRKNCLKFMLYFCYLILFIIILILQLDITASYNQYYLLEILANEKMTLGMDYYVVNGGKGQRLLQETSPEDTSGPPDDGSGPPDDGSGPPDDGSGPPDDGSGPTDDGSGPPDDGSGPPDDGSGPPDDGSGPPDDGSGPPDDGNVPPDDGSEPPDDGSEPPDDGNGPPDDGNNNPDDGSELPDDGGQLPDDGNESPSDETDDDNSAITDPIEITFDDISSRRHIDDWVSNILLENLYSGDTYTYFYQNYIIGEPMVMLMVRSVKEYDNEAKNTNSVLPYYMSSKTYFIDSKLGSEGKTNSVTLEDGTVVENSGESSSTTLTEKGGYYVFYPRNSTEAKEKTYLKDRGLIDRTWVNLMYSYTYINRNTGLAVINYISFVKTPSGEILKFYDAGSTEEYYSTSLQKFRAFLEIVFVLLASLFIYQIVKEMFFDYVKIITNRYDKQSDFMKQQVFWRYLDIEGSKIKNQGCCSFLCLLAYKLILLLIKTTIDIVHVVYIYATKSLFHLINLS